MNKFLWTLSMAIVFYCPFLHAQISDTFEDNDFTANPVWAGTNEKFSVEMGELRLNAAAESGKAYLATSSSVVLNASWEIRIKMDFNPSSANYTRIYLSSDSPDLSGPLSGYFVLVGGGNDEVSLCRQSGNSINTIIKGVNGRVNTSTVDLFIKATRSLEGTWELFSGINPDSYQSEGSANDSEFIPSAYFGFYCEYTSTRSDKFYFDDIVVVGEPYIDNSVDVLPGEIIITEILADPSPSQGLPDAEFLEIYNRSEKEFNLNQLSISDAITTVRLPGVTMAPESYLILVNSLVADVYSSYGNVVPVPSLPSLNNDADVIAIRSIKGITIDSLYYTTSWYQDKIKQDGGWSLERIDLVLICSGRDNWKACEKTNGGTPGTVNSVWAQKPDLSGPKLTQAIVSGENQIQLQFNETLDRQSIVSGNFKVSPDISIVNVSFSSPAMQSIILQTVKPLALKTNYTIVVSGVRDCNGNLIQEDKSSFSFAVPEKADSLDVIINEILFNPFPNGPDFVEVYNRSNKYIDLKNWNLGNFENSTAKNTRIITSDNLLMPPSSYLVFTDDIVSQADNYPNANTQVFYEVTLPSLPDDAGSIAILNDNGKIIDMFQYDASMHSPLLRNKEGVSLERILNTGNTSSQNWTSASTASGYGTPGYVNSNTLGEILSEATLTIKPEVFEPITGYPNFTTINYQLEKSGFICNAKIYDVQGRTIKTLANNDILGTEGFYRWDGDLDDGSKARVGYYFVRFEIFDLTGQVKNYQKRIVIAGRF